MPERTVLLIVVRTGACPLLKAGDQWLIREREVIRTGQARLCAAGLSSIYYKLKNILKELPPGAPLPDDSLLCDSPECGAAFRMQWAPDEQANVENPGAGAKTSARRREHGAREATAILRRQGPFLARLSQELAEELINICTAKHYADTQVILQQGVLNEYLYLLKEGLVDVIRRGKEAEETILVTLGPGECFGEMSLLTGELTSAEVRAHGPADILRVPKITLEGLLLKRPALSHEFSKLLAARLKASNASLESELSRGVLGRLSMLSLLDLVQTLQQTRRTGLLVLTHQDKRAQLGFRDGAICTAVAGQVVGDEAFYQLARWPDGEFCFEQFQPGENEAEKVHTDTMGLMMEALRRIDESKKI